MNFVSKLMSKILDLDYDAPNLYIGKEIGSTKLKGKVVSFDDSNIEMLIVAVNNEYFSRYVDVGQTYPLFRHTYWTFERGLMLWEVNHKYMKRDVSQILLQWEKDIGWTWDMDM